MVLVTMDAHDPKEGVKRSAVAGWHMFERYYLLSFLWHGQIAS
jgi:hypothetical protein